MLISNTHRKRYRDYFAEKGHPAEKPGALVDTIAAMCRTYNYLTVLDYGSGPARQLSRFLPSTFITEDYDPGVPAISSTPIPTDLVVCNHMLEHVEDEASAVSVLKHIKQLALRGAYIAISLEPSTKFLAPDCEWHSLVRDADWWDTLVKKFFPLASSEHDEKQVVYIWSQHDA